MISSDSQMSLWPSQKLGIPALYNMKWYHSYPSSSPPPLLPQPGLGGWRSQSGKSESGPWDHSRPSREKTGNCKRSQQVSKARRKQQIIYGNWTRGLEAGLGSLKDSTEAKLQAPKSPRFQARSEGRDKGSREPVEKASTCSLELNPQPGY